ncbi:pentapeptide repeat-containing protein [Oscillatoria sp. FACHB-1407]|uniref:pentapeptide repeat-containing protein n=1 Tax=Oscillatoria sp. FACHB-1407 TaxID=2692847 RepID=UPI0016884742|nr:pentapeptide repeat-containing protein [Oscillatoria sp. FACHB-1407]MBD2462104.1 pentapeptide repeat-containing protein [Oscillatoria sp. FACHB-1407]
MENSDLNHSISAQFVQPEVRQTSTSSEAISPVSAPYILAQYAKGKRTFTRVVFRAGQIKVVAPNLEQADFAGACLMDVGLTSSNLEKANFNSAKLNRADLSATNLSKANLNKANLNKANLSRADLSGACLIGADLSGANLSAANLTRANLTNADLSNADLSRAVFDQTIMPDGTLMTS